MCSSSTPCCGGCERASKQLFRREDARTASHGASTELCITLQRESGRATQASLDVDGLNERRRCH